MAPSLVNQLWDQESVKKIRSKSIYYKKYAKKFRNYNGDNSQFKGIERQLKYLLKKYRSN